MSDPRREAKKDNAGEARINDALIRSKTGEYDLLCVSRLILSNMGIRRMEGLEGLKNLVELNLTRNMIETIQGISTLRNLRKLVLISNRISKIGNMDHMVSLEHVHLQDNSIQEVEEVTHLNTIPRLQSLYLQNTGGELANPVCSRKGYRGFVLQYLPSLAVLDGERVSSSEALNATLMASSLMNTENGDPIQVPEFKPWGTSFKWDDAFIPKEKIDRSLNTDLFRRNTEDSKKLIQTANAILTQRPSASPPPTGGTRRSSNGPQRPSSSSTNRAGARPGSGGTSGVRTSSKS